MTKLAQLLELPGVWRGSAFASVRTPSVPTGFAKLDRELPGGGWPSGALTELLVTRPGIGEISLLMPALARLTRDRRWLFWIAPPHIPYAPAIAQAGSDPARVIVVNPGPSSHKNHPEVLWTIEQTLRSAVCGAVLAWPGVLTYTQLRRLQIAAEASDALAMLIRPAAVAHEASPAALRLSLMPAPAGALDIHIIKRRGFAAEAPLRLDLHCIINSALHPALHRHALDRARTTRVTARSVPAGEFIN